MTIKTLNDCVQLTPPPQQEIIDILGKELNSVLMAKDDYAQGFKDAITETIKIFRFHPYQSSRDTVHTPIICLCGSTKFTREMLIKQWELTKQGYIVVSWCALPDDYISYQGNEKAHIGDIENVKVFVDEIHKRKIDISDEVLVIDIGGYVGESTRSEINYAITHGKPVRYLSEELHQIKAGEPGISIQCKVKKFDPGYEPCFSCPAVEVCPFELHQTKAGEHP